MEELKDGCLALYNRERAEGTELPAILSMLREHVEQEEARLRKEREEQWQKVRLQEQEAREARLQSGADCKWTQMRGSKLWYCLLKWTDLSPLAG